MSRPYLDADTMLDLYIHDYLMKRGLNATAESFRAEGGKFSVDPQTDPDIEDIPGHGFLFEWFAIFLGKFFGTGNRP